ncbi:tetratricopeptide repeat protein [Mameliella sp. CS4]|uniref:tetratricopeptide repeat protein n=1 Tax=Mameliella sp. CS4 TaxID=2862329 RepID=UPI001C5FC8A3|nr:tetratricopeptide repeat protein [Mameliella sp. CS4]MBW4983788.1 tetratricopeptide repeat protein [Mameliella sp. CS4]
MRHPIIVSLCVAGAVALSACDKGIDSAEMDRKFQGVNVVDESDLNEVMLTVGDPNEAVAYFQRTLKENSDRIEIRRGLAQSLVRAKRIPEAKVAWAKVVEHEDSTDDDRVQLADVLIRAGEWDQAEKVLDAIPPTLETYKRYRLEAMIADSNKEWKKADSFYEVAVGLTTKPASVLNNWGYSKLTRGDLPEAEKLFLEAIRHDDKLYTAKNNLVMARGAQGKYILPVIPMTQVEKAELLHTLGLAAIKSGDVKTGKALLREALETHPQHFEAAARALAALDEA